MKNCSVLEKLAVVYSKLFACAKIGQFDVNETFLEICEKLGIVSFSQQIKIFNAENESVESDGVLIFVNDDKYDYHSLCFSSALIDDLISEGKLSFNSFLIPLKFIDSVKLKFNDMFFRMSPTENEGLFFSNNERNLNIQSFSRITGFKPETIIKMKNENFLSDETLKSVLKIAGLKQDEIINNKTETKDLFFAGQKSFCEDKFLLTSKAKSLINLPIVKDSQNSTFDCASFVSYLFMAELGIDIQEGGFGNSTTGKIMSSKIGRCFLIDEKTSLNNKIDFVLKNTEIGDVMLFHRQSAKCGFVEEDNWYPGHVGIYIGDGKYIDARHRRGDVQIVEIDNDDYMNCFIGFKRFIFEKNYGSQEIETYKQNQ